MRVLFDAFPLLAPKSGVGYYTLNLLKAMSREYPEDEHVYFYGRRFSREILNDAPGFDAGLRKVLKKCFPKPYRITQPIKEMFFRFGAEKHKADIYHELNYVPLPYKGPQVVTVFDMSLIRYPETHPRDRRSYFDSYFKKRLKNASHFITISDFSKRELTELYDVPPEKITTIYLGGLEFTKENPNFTEKLPDKYFLYLGNLEPRKNIPMLLRAYSSAKNKEKDLPKLILAGSPSWLSDEIFKTIGELGLSDSVIVKGYVPLPDLPHYYRNALAFLFPSKYEGFGLPVLEAMGEGTPVIVSDCSSLPEVVGDSGILLPCDEESLWAKAMIDVFQNEALRNELSQKAVSRARLFSWSQCARETRAVYE
ncbi:glycosyltransferase family 4 protein, partial [bacterium]|nr:glycosyltransferase family 4 protein [bacterium]